jgi:hypothetical protein
MPQQQAEHITAKGNKCIVLWLMSTGAINPVFEPEHAMSKALFLIVPTLQRGV